ncbi:single-stranded-DNA-specific exonuclease RecJ [Pleurocapsa sp. CCALA 161]|uniref:single-stranded-DNA-specific exonuclease RecJ n=1 Tax=Pleurocapsa sp. CCALA 161 TaxID=2107688 RepID=UPI000D0515D0|nr:single-stranded-DNA-specific exonuclease RecJ [Pleurocapsa sp. CCALA 161]PSB11148.1 single-stranded-DNA-specific exonuclease RecJ [Pleurocapsa sp. CCALA 161]
MSDRQIEQDLSLTRKRLPNQRWQIAPPQAEKAQELSLATGLLPLVAQVMINREIATAEDAQAYIEPESLDLPSPLDEFKDLAISVELIKNAIADEEAIAICGDYDADGMTSTALLLRALKHLGANVDYAIPSRMKDGYGINNRIVEEFAENGVGLILTVDNGISAYEPVARAVELGLSVIITDHHDLPEKLPPADAILNPKLLKDTSPYKGLAGVGVAYILAIATAQSLGKLKGLTNPIMELFTLGTIADLAPLVGVNRRWLKRGLRALPNSQLLGIQALIQVAGVDEAQKQLKPDDIGFRLGPRINAVGRIGDPQMVIELLTTDDPGIALERAMQCEQINQKRRQLCEQIEQEAIALVENTPIPWQRDRLLVVVAAGWHHGVIGIVASRLVERYGVPVFIGTYEDHEEAEDQEKEKDTPPSPRMIRGSARSIDEFNVFDALNYCSDLLGKYGGHRAAGGFSFLADNLEQVTQRLSEFAHKCLEVEHLKPLVKIDAQASLGQVNYELYQQIESLQPWGIGNSTPVFWTPNVRVIEQRAIGKTQTHLKLTLQEEGSATQIKALAWRWGEYCPLPEHLDIAYKLKENHWQGNTNIELELVGVKSQVQPSNNISATNKPIKNSNVQKAVFTHSGRIYVCSKTTKELRIRNDRGNVLAVSQGDRTGLLGKSREVAKQVNVTQAPYFQLIKVALEAIKKDNF